MVRVYEQVQQETYSNNPLNWVEKYLEGPYILETNLSQNDFEPTQSQWITDSLEKANSLSTPLDMSVLKLSHFPDSLSINSKFNTIIIRGTLLSLTNKLSEMENLLNHSLSDGGRVILLSDIFSEGSTHERVFSFNKIVQALPIDRLVNCSVSTDWAGIVLSKEMQAGDQLVSAIFETSMHKEKELLNKIQDLEGYIEVIQKEKISHNELAKLIKKQSLVVNRIKKNQEKVPASSKADTREIERLTQLLIKEKENKIELKNQMIAMYKKESTLLKSHKKLMKSYESLSNSKLGRLTIAYWKFINRIKRGK